MRLSKVQRATLREKFGGMCAYCGTPLGDRWHADHVEPVERVMAVRGGRFVSTGEVYRPERDVFGNMNPACAPCNISKGPLSLEHWREWLLGHVRALNAHNTPYRLVKSFGLVIETGNPIVFHFERHASTEADRRSRVQGGNTNPESPESSPQALSHDTEAGKKASE